MPANVQTSAAKTPTTPAGGDGARKSPPPKPTHRFTDWAII